MNVWIINPYGGLPQESWREYRSWMLAKALERAGHRVTWWLSDFEHRNKTRRASSGQVVFLSSGISAIVVPSGSYNRNISLRRIYYEMRFASKTRRMANYQKKPDLIVLAEPALFYGWPIVRLCRRCGIPFVVDILDIWPEAFVMVLPKPFRILQGLFFWPLYQARKRLIRNASAILAVSKDYAEIGSRASRKLPFFTAYLGVDLHEFILNTLKTTEEMRCDGIVLPPKKPGEIWAIFAGTLGEGYDLPALIQAIRKIANRCISIRILIAGQGPFKAILDVLAQELPETFSFLGSVSACNLPALYKFCDIGIASYAEGSSVSMPVKVYDYFAGGLAIITSLRREVGELLREFECGVEYVPGSAQSLVDALVKLHSNIPKLCKMKENSRSLRTRFDNVEQHDKAAAFLQSCIDTIINREQIVCRDKKRN